MESQESVETTIDIRRDRSEKRLIDGDDFLNWSATVISIKGRADFEE